jgi:hypothetical protein
VAAKPGELRFFVDETSLGLGRGLAWLRADLVHTGHRLIPEVPLGSKDPVWMPAVAKRGLVVLTRDKRIRTKHAKILRLMEHGLRVFVVGGKRDLSNWDAVSLLVRRWDAMERVIEMAGPGPWFYRIGADAISPMPLPPLEP